MISEYAHEHGYFEVYVLLWDGENQPVNATVDVVADEDVIDDIANDLWAALKNYGRDDGDDPHRERIFHGELFDMIDRNLVWDMSCRHYGIDSVSDFERLRENDEIELFPLY